MAKEKKPEVKKENKALNNVVNEINTKNCVLNNNP